MGERTGIVVLFRTFASWLSICTSLTFAQPIISTYVGGPPRNGPALDLSLPYVSDIKADNSGNLYIAVYWLNVIYRLDTAGNLTVIAGTGVGAFGGDGGPGTQASLYWPSSLALDKLGNLYIADLANNRVRKLNLTTGVITTFAGDGRSTGYCYPQKICDVGDGGPAASAAVSPVSLATDTSGNLYIAEYERIRRVSGTTITTVAGTGVAGYSGDGGPATQAQIRGGPIVLDASDNLYISDRQDNVVRKLANGIISTAVGTGMPGYSGDGGPATQALLNSPGPLACDTAGDLYIADNGHIRKVSGGTISTVSQFSAQSGLAIARDGTLLVTDAISQIWKVQGNSRTAIAGNGQYYFNGDNIPASQAAIVPDGSSMALDAQGNLYFSDSQNSRVRKVSRAGFVTTVAGTGSDGFSGDNGPAAMAKLDYPQGVAIDRSGRIYIADLSNARIRVIDTNGIISTFAGTGRYEYNGEGLHRLAANVMPWSLAIDDHGVLYFGDNSNRIRKIANGVVTTVVGTGLPGQSSICATGSAISISLSANPAFLALDATGVLYFTQYLEGCVRRLNNGSVERFAGASSWGGEPTGDGGPAIDAQLTNPHQLAFDAAGRLYISDARRVRRVSHGVITPFAGRGIDAQAVGASLPAGFVNGDGGPATSALLGPGALIVDPEGSLLIADGSQFRIRKVTHIETPVIRDFDGTGRSSMLLYHPFTGQSYTAITNAGGSYDYTSNLFTAGFDTLRTGDFNGDGKADLIVYNSKTALAYIGFSKGDGTFAFQSLFWSPNYGFVEMGDLNSDGKTDVALYNSSTGTLYTGISTGNGTFTYKYTLISRGFTFERLADFNGDGKADIIVYNTASGSLYVGIGDGTGRFSFGPSFVSPGYNLADIGDLNGDGKADLILYNSSNGNAATGISNGAGGFTFMPQIFSPGFTSVRLADHTGDGLADVTLYNKNNAVAYFGTGAGNGNFTFQSLFWSPGYDQVVPQDVNGDGKIDIVLYNSATGTEYTGISNGNAMFNYTYQYWGIGKVLAR